MRQALVAVAAIAAVSLTHAWAQDGEATLLFLRSDPAPPTLQELMRGGLSDAALGIIAQSGMFNSISLGRGTVTYRRFDNQQCEGRATSLARLSTENKDDWKSVKAPAVAPIYIQTVSNRFEYNRQNICITVTRLVPESGRTYRILPAGNCGIFAYDEQTRTAAPGLETYPVEGRCERW